MKVDDLWVGGRGSFRNRGLIFSEFHPMRTYCCHGLGVGAWSGGYTSLSAMNISEQTDSTDQLSSWARRDKWAGELGSKIPVPEQEPART